MESASKSNFSLEIIEPSLKTKFKQLFLQRVNDCHSLQSTRDTIQYDALLNLTEDDEVGCEKPAINSTTNTFTGCPE